MEGTIYIYRPLGYERVYLPLYKVADTPFQIQGDDILSKQGDGNFQKYIVVNFIKQNTIIDYVSIIFTMKDI